jgi:hypothetical protein
MNSHSNHPTRYGIWYVVFEMAFFLSFLVALFLFGFVTGKKLEQKRYNINSNTAKGTVYIIVKK